MKKILGLDIGTNSIGWALIEKENEMGNILGMGTRIIPMGDDKGNFEAGKKITRNAVRRQARGIRKLNHRYKQRRNKLIYVLYQLGLLPEQFKFHVPEKFQDSDSPFPKAENLQHLSLKRIEPATKQLTAVSLFELRAKALHHSLTDLHDLGRLIYLFNQRRGYAGGGDENENDQLQSPNEEESETNRKFEKEIIKIALIKVEKSSDTFISKKRDKQETLNYYNITLEDGRTCKTRIQDFKEGEEYELEVTERYNKKGERTSIEASYPKKTDWRKQLESFEDELEKSGLLLGEFLFINLQNNPFYKIRERVILRKRYQEEFDATWRKQLETNEAFRNTINNKSLLEKTINYVFPGSSPTQEKYRKDALQKGFFHLIRNQIIFYQRNLKDQRDKIGNCQFEKSEKVIPKSHPLYQEFRIWQQLNNLSVDKKFINKKGKSKYLKTFLTNVQREQLFSILQQQKDLKFGSLYTKLNLKKAVDYLQGLHVKKSLKGNETLLTIQNALGEDIFYHLFQSTEKLSASDENYLELWNIIFEAYGNEYDPDSDRVKQIQQFLTKHLDNFSFANSKEEFNNQLSIKLAKVKFKREYGSLSVKALENILPFMRTGKISLNEWQLERIEKLENGEADENIETGLREFYLDYKENGLSFEDAGMPYWAAASFIYGKHTAENISSEKSFNNYHQIQPIEQYSLRNPIVEQILNETLQLVKSVWKQYGEKPAEIRVELARELKNNAEQRKKIFESNIRNEKNNKRVKELLIELGVPTTLTNIERYKIWEEQGKVSPYTGKPIPVNAIDGLFDKSKYDIDHIIPRQRFFDDSLANKTVCENSINKLKDNRTAFEFINQCSGTNGLLTFEQFEEHIRVNFRGRKLKNFLLKQIPDDFVERQKKDTQYIAIKTKERLGEIIGTNNVKTTTGGVTDYLKHSWGLNDNFKLICKERFEQIATTLNVPIEKWVSEKIMENGKGLPEKQLNLTNWSKRIDHRHHAIDALTVACTEPRDIKRLNELNKELQTRIESKRPEILAITNIESDDTLTEAFLKLSREQKRIILSEYDSLTKFPEPWKNFISDAKNKIASLVISYKSKNRIVIDKKEINYGKKKEIKEVVRIRSALHQETYYGFHNGQNTYRVPLVSFASKSDKAKDEKESAVEKAIKRIVDKNLRNEIEQHYKITFKKDVKSAFSEEGIRAFNEKRKIPVETVSVYYSVDENENVRLQKLDRQFNDAIYVKTGDNYCFAVLEKDGKRRYDFITLYKAASLCSSEFKENKRVPKEVISEYFQIENKEYKFLFTLMQDEFVYVPFEYEDRITLPANIQDESYTDFWFNKEHKRWKRIYRVVKFSGDFCYFLPHNISKSIIDKKEFGTQNCSLYPVETMNLTTKEKNKLGIKKIQDNCIKIQVDRLGNISLPSKQKNYSPTSNQQNTLNEPEAAYQNKQITTFTSFDEMENDQLQYFASLQPQQLLQNLKTMVLAAFGFSEQPSIHSMPRKIRHTK